MKRNIIIIVLLFVCGLAKAQDVVDIISTKDIQILQEADNYPQGTYWPTQSSSCMEALNFIREELDGELRQYLTPKTRVMINITGEVDASAIAMDVPYNGEFGDFNQVPTSINGEAEMVTIESGTGISRNGYLGYLRAQGVRYFMENRIAALKETQNTYVISVIEHPEKGAEYRKVSIEVTIQNTGDK